MPRAKPAVQWSSTLVVTLKRGLAGKRWDQRATVTALGLRKRESSVLKPNNNSVLGMLDKVKRLVQVETLEMFEERTRRERERKAWQAPLVFSHAPAGQPPSQPGTEPPATQ